MLWSRMQIVPGGIILCFNVSSADSNSVVVKSFNGEMQVACETACMNN